MKKFFLILLVLAFAVAGVAGALAVVPHGHDEDFDHSKHASCPVYQAQLQGTNALIPSMVFLVFVSLVLFFLKTSSFVCPPSFSFLFSSLRAPPA
jgi:hypothetical protein